MVIKHAQLQIFFVLVEPGKIVAQILLLIPKKGSPLCNTKQPTPIQGTLWQTEHQAQRKRRRNKCQQRQLDKVRITRHRYTLLTNNHNPRLRTAAHQAAPPRRNATSTTLLPRLVLGFPPARGGRPGWTSPDTLQE